MEYFIVYLEVGNRVMRSLRVNFLPELTILFLLLFLENLASQEDLFHLSNLVCR